MPLGRGGEMVAVVEEATVSIVDNIYRAILGRYVHHNAWTSHLLPARIMIVTTVHVDMKILRIFNEYMERLTALLGHLHAPSRQLGKSD